MVVSAIPATWAMETILKARKKRVNIGDFM
jgi:hypothetical protein